MARKRFSPEAFLSTVGYGKSLLTFPKKHILFSQGNVADAVFYIQKGEVKLSVMSKDHKEAVIAILEKGSFVGGGLSRGTADLDGDGRHYERLFPVAH